MNHREQPKPIYQNGQSARDLRRKLGLNQSEFWARVGVTQSGGSRYEGGRDMPVQIAWLLDIAYGTDRQAEALVAWLRKEEPNNEP